MTWTTYAIGDIHGRLDLLREALATISAHAAAGSHRIILLGDLVDRGPDSAAVVSLAMDQTDGKRFITLKGNHEELMLRSLRSGDMDAMAMWLDNGGETTAMSYGGLRAVPAAHLAWIAALPIHWSDEHRVFVHAGLAPGVAVSAQAERSMLWIRETFLTAKARDLPCHVVHGHTPLWSGKPVMSRPERLPHRTNLDTGAYATGVLSVGVFPDDIAGGPLDILSIRA